MVFWRNQRMDIGLSTVFCLLWMGIVTCGQILWSEYAKSEQFELFIVWDDSISTSFGHFHGRCLCHRCKKVNAPFRISNEFNCVQLIFIFRCVNQLSSNKSEQLLLSTALLSNFGLLIIDHIHFQYNGILFGILLLSISFMLEERFLCSAFFFAILLNMKHIFVYISPVYIVYLLKVYCWQSESIPKALKNLMNLAIITTGVTAISFGPFCANILQVKNKGINNRKDLLSLTDWFLILLQVLSRLFPFKRGLCHAYWAPNFWALYNMIDKIASIVLKMKPSTSSNTGGLVQEYEHQYLPVVRPIATFVLTFVAILPCVLKIAFSSHSRWVDFTSIDCTNSYQDLIELFQSNSKIWLYTWNCYLRTFFIYVWMACSWKSHTIGFHSIEVCSFNSNEYMY